MAEVSFPASTFLYGKQLKYEVTAGQEGLKDEKGNAIQAFDVPVFHSRQLTEIEIKQKQLLIEAVKSKKLQTDDYTDALAQQFSDDFAFHNEIGLRTATMKLLDIRLQEYGLNVKVINQWHFSKRDVIQEIADVVLQSAEQATFIAVGYTNQGAHWVIYLFSPISQTKVQFVQNDVPIANIVYNDAISGAITNSVGSIDSIGYNGQNISIMFQSKQYQSNVTVDAWKIPTRVTVDLNVAVDFKLFDNITELSQASRFQFQVFSGGNQVCSAQSCVIKQYDPSGLATYKVTDNQGIFSPVEGIVPLKFERHFEGVWLKRAALRRVTVQISKNTVDEVLLSTNVSGLLSIHDNLEPSRTYYTLYEPDGQKLLERGTSIQITLDVKKSVSGEVKNFKIQDNVTLTGEPDMVLVYACSQIIIGASGPKCAPECGGFLEGGVCYEKCADHPSKSIAVIEFTGFKCIAVDQCASNVVRIIAEERFCIVSASWTGCREALVRDQLHENLSICNDTCTGTDKILDFGMASCTSDVTNYRVKRFQDVYYAVQSCSSSEAEISDQNLPQTIKVCQQCASGEILLKKQKNCIKLTDCSTIRQVQFIPSVCDTECLYKFQQMCLDSCFGFFMSEKTCLRQCPSELSSKAGICLENCDISRNGICVDTCPELYFAYKSKCVLECPTNTFYSREKNTCVSSCLSINHQGVFTAETDKPIVKTVQRSVCEKIGSLYCPIIYNSLCLKRCGWFSVSSSKTACTFDCTSTEPYLNGSICQSKCENNNFILSKAKCASERPPLHYIQDKTYVSECSVFATRDFICQDQCEYGNFTHIQAVCETLGKQYCPKYQFTGNDLSCPSQYKCLDNCQDGYVELQTKPECVLGCQIGKYYYQHACVDNCPTGTFYYEEKSCEQICNDYIIEIGDKGFVGCSKACKSEVIERGTKKCISKCQYLDQTKTICEIPGSEHCPYYEWADGISANICKVSCLYKEYNGQCVDSCPANAAYSNGNKCTDHCMYAVYNKMCVDSCPSFSVIFEKECYSVCPTGYQPNATRNCVQPSVGNKVGLIILGIVIAMVVIALITLTWCWLHVKRIERRAENEEASSLAKERSLVREPQMLI